MAFKTKRDLLEWLGEGDGTGEAYIKRDWLIWVDAGNVVAQHPTCPAMRASYPIADGEEETDD